VGYAIFDTPAIHGIPGIKELAHAGRDMVPPLVIAPAQLLQVLNDWSVNIALRHPGRARRPARTSALDRECLKAVRYGARVIP
jgi:hypothetical protein